MAVFKAVFKAPHETSLPIQPPTQSPIQPIILDSNVWLDWLLFDDAIATPIKAQFDLGRVCILGTDSMRAELLDVLSRDSVGAKFSARSKFASIEAMMAEYDRLVSTQVRPDVTALYLPQCKDKNDQMFVDLAVTSKALLLSKDKHLLSMAPKLKKHYGVQVLHPRKFA
jgi:putative PIN family toxin of toxin-antitoxin system